MGGISRKRRREGRGGKLLLLPLPRGKRGEKKKEEKGSLSLQHTVTYQGVPKM